MAEPEKSKALESIMSGISPQSPEEWKELGKFLSSVAGFLGAVGSELDHVEVALDISEKLFEVLADAQTPETKALMKEVVAHAYEGQGVPLSELQEEDNGSGGEGPAESGEEWLLPQ